MLVETVDLGLGDMLRPDTLTHSHPDAFGIARMIG